MDKIKGLFETHINVFELERSMVFYEDVIGLELGTLGKKRRIAFYFIGGWANTMLGVWEKPDVQIQRQHFAFEVEVADMDGEIAELKSKSIPTSNFFGEETEMPSVFGWVPAVSIYFPDPDGHNLEYIAKLSGPPKPEAGIVPWEEWQRAKRHES